jgi:hypothetical protein
VPVSARSRLVTAAAATIVLAVGIERVRAFAAAPPTDFDDAYMFARYAKHLAAGHGLTWNIGEPPVNGVTGLLHLLVVTLFHMLRPAWDDGRLLVAASAAAGLLAIAAIALTCARFSPHPALRGRPLVWAAIFLPLIAYGEAFGFHARTGMDTMSSLLANVVLIFATLRLCEQPSRRAAALCALAGWLAIFARPDNALYALLCPLGAIALVCPRPRRPLLATFVPLLALLVGLDLGLRRVFLGTALPLAFYAKRPFAYGGFVGEYTWNPFLFLEVFLTAAAPFLIVLLLFARRRHARTLAVLLIPLALTCASLFSLNHIMGHLGRFFFPSLPFLAIPAAGVIDAQWRAWTLLNGTLRAALTALFLLAGPTALEAAARRYESRAATQPLASLDGWSIPAQAELPELDSWRSSIEIAQFAAAAPPGSSFAMSEHGLVGARAPDAKIIDLVGLHDREVALHGFSIRALERKQPDVIWLPHWDYTQMLRDLYDSDDFWTHYDFYPDAFTYGVALRRDSPRAAALRELFMQRWKVSYPGVPLDERLARRVLR